MKKMSVSSGFLSLRVSFALVLCSLGVLLGIFSVAGNPVFVGNQKVPFKGTAAMRLGPTGPGWSIVQSPNNGSSATNQLFATTCASVSDCWAVGYSDMGNGYHTLIERWNGAAWTIVSSPNNSGNNILYGVTCNSTSDCWAVGTYFDDDLFQRTLIEHWNGNAWNIVSSPNRGLSSPPIDVLVGVSCVSASECWAAGSNDDSNGVGQTLTERWDGNAWTIVDSPNPSGSNSFQGVTCASTLQSEECWAVGETVTGYGRAETLIEKWDGSVWSLVSSPNNGMYNDLLGVTCASEADCWAVGYYSGVTNDQTLIERWNGSVWAIVSSSNTSTMQDNFLTAVACASAAQCWAVGYYEHAAFIAQTLIERWDGNSWTIVSSPNPNGADGSQLLGVTCASTDQCWAAGYYGNSNSVPQTLVEEYALTIPPLTGVVSRMTHGAAGNFDIDLPIAGVRGVECRSGGSGGNYGVVFSFVNNVTNCGTAGTTGGSVTPGPNPNQCTENLTGVANAQYIAVVLNNVLDSENNTGDVSAPMGVLIGDTNGNAIVNASDVGQAKGQVGQPVTDVNFRSDVNANGIINAADIAIIKVHVGTSLPP